MIPMMLLGNLWALGITIIFSLVLVSILPSYFKYKNIEYKRKNIKKIFTKMFYSSYLIEEINRLTISNLNSEYIGDLNDLSDIFDYAIIYKNSEFDEHIAKKLYADYIFELLKKRQYSFTLTPNQISGYTLDYELSIYRKGKIRKISKDYDIASNQIQKINNLTFSKKLSLE